MHNIKKEGISAAKQNLYLGCQTLQKVTKTLICTLDDWLK